MGLSLPRESGSANSARYPTSKSESCRNAIWLILRLESQAGRKIPTRYIVILVILTSAKMIRSNESNNTVIFDILNQPEGLGDLKMPTRRALLKSSLLLPFLPEVLARSASAQEIRFGSSAIDFLSDEQRSLLNFFLQNSIDERIRELNYAGYEVSIAKLQEITGKVTQRVISPDLDYVQNRSVQEWGQLIKDAANQVIATLDFKPNEVLEQRIWAQGLCDWIRTHLVYDHEWATFHGTPGYLKVPYKERERHWTSTGILALPNPKGVCAGFLHTTTDIAKAMGLNCHEAIGYQRWGMSFKDGWPTGATHSWNIFELPDGLLIPSDNSISFIPLEKARLLNGRIHHPISLPLHAEEWGIFLAFHYAHDDISKLPLEKQDIYSLLSIPFSQWKGVNITTLSLQRKILAMQD